MRILIHLLEETTVEVTIEAEEEITTIIEVKTVGVATPQT